MTFNTIKNNIKDRIKFGFKPCYIWMTFNTDADLQETIKKVNEVLNLVIYG